MTALLCAGLVATAPGSGAAKQVPNPCEAVPSTMVAKALGLKKPPPSALAVVAGIETCSYTGIRLTVAVGNAAIQNPATPLKVATVHGLPNGRFTTYAGSTQTQLFFYKGSSANGTFAVIRNYGRIKRSKLEKFAKALYAAMAGSGGSAPPPGVKIISN